MKSKIFTVYDSKTEAYLSPFYMTSTGQAVRSFTEAVNDEKTSFYKYPADFTLFEIGTFDDQNCEIEIWEVKKSLGLAIEFKEDRINPFQLKEAK